MTTKLKEGGGGVKALVVGPLICFATYARRFKKPFHKITMEERDNCMVADLTYRHYTTGLAK